MSGVLSLSRWRMALSASSISSVNFTYFERFDNRTGLRSYMPLLSAAPLRMSMGRSCLRQSWVTTQPEMRAGGMGREIKPSGITAKARGIAVDPGDCPAHLLDHGKQACAGVVHIRKVENDVMRPCLHERFGQKRVIGTAIGPPRATVDENVDRRLRRFGTVDVELLDLARPISHALRKP